MHIKRSAYNDIDSPDKKFRKMIQTSADKIVNMQLYTSERRVAGFYDPMIKISEEIHQLLFQHLNGRDVLNCFEVSKTWNNFCKQSNFCARKYNLYVKESFDENDRTMLQESNRKYLNMICDFYQPTMIQSYSNLKKLSLRFCVPNKISDVQFTNLETLIIQKCPGKLYNPDHIVQCFKIFSRCTTLKFLEMYEAITEENVNLIWDLLQNNTGLKTLKIHPCSEFYHLFSGDYISNMAFRLTRLHYAIPEKFKITGTEFERNVVNFFKRQDKLRILDMNQATAKMMNAAFSNMKHIETIRVLRISGLEGLELEMCESLTEFILPNTPGLIYINTNAIFEHKSFIDAAPNLELLYVFTLTKEIVDYIARKLLKLKILSYNKNDGPDAKKFYRTMQRTIPSVMNRNITIRQVKFKFVDGEDRTYERIFGESCDQ